MADESSPGGGGSWPAPYSGDFPRPGTGRIRILHIINDLAVGGSEMSLYRLLSATDRDLFEPVVISLREPGALCGRIESLGVPVLKSGMKGSLPSPASLWTLARLVRKVNADLIQGWMYHGSLAALFARSLAPREVPVLWSIRNGLNSLSNEKPITSLVIRLCALLSGRASRVVFVSFANRWQHESFGYSRENGRVIPNGFDVRSPAWRAEARHRLRESLGVSEETLLIGHVGRFHPSKDHATFLRAASLLAQEQRRDVQFVLCGSRVDLDNPTLVELCRELGLGGRTHLLGERSDAQALMAAVDIMASSSRAEACPNVIGEAMACGIPCVVTNVGDMPRMVGATGQVVPPEDPLALADAWRRLIALGEEGRAALGHAARARVADHFSLESAVRQYESLYRSMVPCASEVTKAWQNLDVPQLSTGGRC